MGKKSRKHEQIFGIRVNSTQKQIVLRKLRSALVKRDKKKERKDPLLIVTPNPEIVTRGAKDKNFAKIINSSDFSIPDGIGLAQAVKFLKLPNPKNVLLRIPVLLYQGFLVGVSTIFYKKWLTEDFEIIKGRKFFVDLLKLSNKKGWRVYLLGGREVSEQMSDTIKRTFKQIDVKAKAGPKLTKSGNPVTKDDIKLEKDILREINDFSPHFLFVAMTPPKQEKWLSKYLNDLDVGAAMTVGGTFDYLVGKVKQPPTWMEVLGLEWLWRLLTQPSFERAGRIATAFPIFPLRVFWYKLTK